jgi:chitinase
MILRNVYGLLCTSVDLDIEQGGSTGYAAFVTEIRALASGASKQYVIHC